jgi:aspartyl-tRNA(Asn)/glutamyl-tRNA(Gln) amidotransferase subunit A
MAIPDVRASARQCATATSAHANSSRQALDRIGGDAAALNAFVHVDAEGALAAADDVDRARRRRPLGPLAGVPFGVKDLEDCIGMPTTTRLTLVRRRRPGDP